MMGSALICMAVIVVLSAGARADAQAAYRACRYKLPAQHYTWVSRYVEELDDQRNGALLLSVLLDLDGISQKYGAERKAEIVGQLYRDASLETLRERVFKWSERAYDCIMDVESKVFKKFAAGGTEPDYEPTAAETDELTATHVTDE